MAKKRSRGRTRAKGIPDHIAEQLDDVKRFPCIYVFRAEEIYKIGKTLNSINERFYGWWRKTGCPSDFELIHRIPVIPPSETWLASSETLDQAEKSIHRYFAARRLHRRIEHFNLTDDDVTYIKSLVRYQNGGFVTPPLNKKAASN